MTDRDVLGRIVRDFQAQARAWEPQVAAACERIRLLGRSVGRQVSVHIGPPIAESLTPPASTGRTPPPDPEAP